MHPANWLIQKTQTCSYWLLPCVYYVTDAQKRKSKWDSALPVTLAQPTLITTTATLPAVVSVTTTASGTKTTVISAVGTILKKAKQWGWWTGCSEDDERAAAWPMAYNVLHLLYMWKVMDTFSEPAHKFFLLLVDSQRLKTAFYLWDCICIMASQSQTEHGDNTPL